MAKQNKSPKLIFVITALIAVIIGFLGLKMCSNEEDDINSVDPISHEPDSLSSSEEDALFKDFIKTFPGKDNSYKEETGETLAEGEVDKETLSITQKDSINGDENLEETNQPENDENADDDANQTTPKTEDQ